VTRNQVFYSWSAQAEIDPIVITRGEGCRMWDDAGHCYLDFSSQLVNLNLGHQHPRVIAAIKDQADRLCTVAPFHANDTRSELARRIAEISPNPDHDHTAVFFTNGGAEAVENATRMARLHTGRLKILSMYRSYHGSTAGAISFTGDSRRWPNEPGVPGAVHFFGPYLYRSAFQATTEQEECDRAIAHLQDVIELEGPSTVAAVLIESVVGTNGILVPPDGYLAGVRDICDRYGIVMICDEVMCGFGRTGEWFAVDHWRVVPDLITFAKGVNSGYVPLGGVIISPGIAETFQHTPFPGGLTYSGHPLACAAALATLDVYRDDDILAAVRRKHDVVAKLLGDLKDRHDRVGEVRGLGLFWAIELDDDAPMATIARDCKARGLWPLVQANRIHVVPPLIVTEDELAEATNIIDDVLTQLR
jgi:taurine--2-oxoglutarate transaminase